MDAVDSLILDLLEWIGPEPRPYAEVQEVWRTTCPRLSIWEDALAAGLIERRFASGDEMLVAVSAGGEALLGARS